MRQLIPILLFLLVTNCSTPIDQETEQIKAYYEGFENGNYNQIKKNIADSFTIVEGDFKMEFTQDSYHNQFAWDSIFKPVYTLDTIYKENQDIIATASIHSLRFEYLKNNPLQCNHKFQFKNGKISHMINLECPSANWTTWKQQVDSLVNWTRRNHPELDGFINDLSMQGAQKYLRAIELYSQQTAN